MVEQIPAKVRKSVEEGSSQIEKAIADAETKKSIVDLLQSYSILDRRRLFGKTTYLIQSLQKLCGGKGTELIVNVLSRGSSEGAFKLIEEVKNDDVRHFLEALVVRYGAQYQWLFEPFQHDWERYELRTSYLGTPRLPVISMRIVDKSGTLMELESPIATYVDLVQALVGHLKSIAEEMKSFGQPKALEKLGQIDKLKGMKKTIEETLETPSEQ
jgi:hypothetical protein